jgi:hypothetical protein
MKYFQALLSNITTDTARDECPATSVIMEFPAPSKNVVFYSEISAMCWNTHF